MLNHMRENETSDMVDLMERVRMECSAEHSPGYSNKTAWSWNQFSSDNNYQGSSHEIVGLVEDKEIAARAVAFVVNSTRKGIIPLCADVAHLMRSKQCLERKLHILKKETEAFQSSASAASLPSHSMSPTPPSLSSYTENCIKALQEQSLAVQELYRSNSRCSNSSSTYSYSPKMDKPRGGNNACQFGVQYSPITDTERRKGSYQSNRFMHSANSGFQRSNKSTYSKHCQEKTVHPNADTCVTIENEENNSTWKDDIETGNSPNDRELPASDREPAVEHQVRVVTEVNGGEVGIDVSNLPEYTHAIGNMVSALHCHLADETSAVDVREAKTETIGNASVPNKEGGALEDDVLETQKPGVQRPLLERRRVSLPEMTSLPDEHATRVRPKQSKQVQCSMISAGCDPTLEDQFMKSVRLNAKLEEELSNARKEIDQLKKRLLRSEASGAIPKSSTRYADEDSKSMEDNGYYTGSNRTSRNSSEHEKSSGGMTKGPKRVAAITVSYTGPLTSCKCSGCLDAIGSEEDLAHYSDQYLEEPVRYAVNSKLQVQVGDHVSTKSHKSGQIRYIGHVDKLTNEINSTFVGLEIDDQGGDHDGFYKGKRYFYCKDKHGVFVPLTDVLGKISKKPQIKPLKEDFLKLKKHPRKASTREDKVTHL